MQYWSYDLAPKQQQQQQSSSGWSTSSSDYLPHFSKVETTHSVPDEFPRYPNVYKAFNNNYAYGGQKQESSSRREDRVEHQKKPSSPKAQKKVRVTEPVEVVERPPKEDVDQNRKGGHGESIDTLAAGFIHRKHLQLSKWNTFKVSS